MKTTSYPPWIIILSVLGGSLANFILSTINMYYNSPLFFDSIFIIVVSYALGLIPGAATALLSSGAVFLMSYLPESMGIGYTPFPFVICSLSTSLITTAFRKKLRNTDLKDFLVLGFLISLTNGIFGNIISYFVFEGKTAGHGIEHVVRSFLMIGQHLGPAVFSAGMLTNFIDKYLSVFAVYAVLLFMKGKRADAVNPHLSEKAVQEKAGLSH